MAYNRNNAVKAYLSNDSDYRAWWDAIRAQLTAVGLVQTSDTGQLNPASHARPSTNSYSGYEVWRFADSLQGTLPIILKVEPGIGSAADRPAIRLTVCTSTNGAGTPSGQIGTAVVAFTAASKGSGDTLVSVASHGEGYLHFLTNIDVNSTSYAFGFVVERPFSNGAPTAEGILTLTIAGTNGGRKQVIPPSGTVPTQRTSVGSAGMFPSLNSTQGHNTSNGTNFAVMLGTYPAAAGQRFTCAGVYNCAGDLTGDLVDLDGSSNPKVTMWGQQWKYLAIGDALSAAGGLTTETGDSLAIRAE